MGREVRAIRALTRRTRGHPEYVFDMRGSVAERFDLWQILRTAKAEPLKYCSIISLLDYEANGFGSSGLG